LILEVVDKKRGSAVKALFDKKNRLNTIIKNKRGYLLFLLALGGH
jgi:hypothetical protein